MNIFDSKVDIASLVSRISQVETKQNFRKQNIAWLKQYFDDLKQEFNTRPELKQIQNIQEAIAQLTAQVAELQQQLNHSPNLSKNLDNNDAIHVPIQEVNIDDAEVPKQLFGTVEQQKSQLPLVDIVAIPENIEIAEKEQNEQKYLAGEQAQINTNLSVQQFHIERIMWLVNRIYAIDEQKQNPCIDAEEFWKRYRARKRNFTGINMPGVNLNERGASHFCRNTDS